MSKIVTPIVHLNGTSKAVLLSQLSDVYDALNVAADKLKQAAPNGRDYYMVAGLLEQAIEQHRGRMAIVRCLQDEIEKQMDLIESQG